MSRVETIGLATLYLGDCREIVPTLPRPAALITDPPYGQGYVHRPGGRGVKQASGNITHGFKRRNIAVVGDDAPFDPSRWLGVADVVLLWGAHHFASRLPDGAWLVWDKVPNGKRRDQGDGEVAWINRPPGPVRIFRHLWDGVCVADRSDINGGRTHPMQKPVALMSWCLAEAKAPEGGTVIDPYMGSGSAGIAAVQAGFPFVGIEIEEAYFATACRRIADAQRQGDLLRDTGRAGLPAGATRRRSAGRMNHAG